MSTQCPICNKDDAVRKVSSVVALGHASGTFGGPSIGLSTSGDEWGIVGGFYRHAGELTTELAQRLSPPERASGLSCFVWGLAINPGWIIVSIPIALFHRILIDFLFIDQTVSAIITTPFIIVWSVIYFRYIKNLHETKLSQEKLRYEIQDQFYNRQYYCFRDDIVFDPKFGDQIPSISFQSSLGEFVEKS